MNANLFNNEFNASIGFDCVFNWSGLTIEETTDLFLMGCEL